MSKDRVNPIKVILLFLSMAVIISLTAGYFFRPFDPSLQSWKNRLICGLGGAVLSIYILLAIKYWKTAHRRSWQLFQIVILTALTGLLVQMTGGFSSPLILLYGLLIVITIYRSHRWKIVPFAAALIIELGSSVFAERWNQEIIQAAFTVLALLLIYIASITLVKRGNLLRDEVALDSDFCEPLQIQKDLKEDLSSLCNLIQAAMRARTTAIFKYDNLSKILNMVAYKSYSSEVIKNAVIEVRSSLIGWAARERQGLLYGNYERDAKDLGYYTKAVEVRSVLAVPIQQESETVGLIVIDSDQSGAFNENDKILLGGFAEEAAKLIRFHHSHSALGLEKDRLQQWNSYLEKMASRLKIVDVIKIIQELIPQLFPCDHIVLLEMLPEPEKAKVLLSDPSSAGYPSPGKEMNIAGSLSEQAFKLKECRSVDDFYRRTVGINRFSADERPDHGFRSVLAAPLLYEDVCHYILILESRQPFAFDADSNTIHIIASQFSLALKSAAMYEEKERLSIRDGLTGLANHRRFQEYLEETIKKSGRQSVGMALFDIDYFKKLNDSYGHPVGDAVLKEVAVRLRRTISQFDFVARYGGEEFVAVWPGRNDKEAATLAEQVRLAIGTDKFKTPAGDLAVTISMGVSSYPQDAKGKQELIKTADDALYAAKNSGRNRVIRFAAMEKVEN